MNNDFFLESYQNFLVNTIQENLLQTNELRIVTQSLMPHQVFTIFTHLNQVLPLSDQFKNYFKVAHGLIQYWENQDLNSLDQQAFSDLAKNNWLDYEDKLTWYRNRTLNDEQVDQLLILLVGLDHTTDKGGLSDFFICDDEKIWLSLDKKYQTWLTTAFESIDIYVSESQLQQFNATFERVNQLIPLTLNQRSQLLMQCFTDVKDPTEFNDIFSYFFKVLPKIGIPYLNIENDLKAFQSKKGLQYLKNAYEFISHARYKAKARKKNDFQKIHKSLSADHFEIQDIEGVSLIEVEAYLENVEAFIFNAHPEAKDYLKHLDLLPLVKALGLKEEKTSEPKQSIPLYRGHSLEAVQKGLHFAIQQYQKNNDFSEVTQINIAVKHFQHDLSDHNNSTQNLAHEALARMLLHSALGGIAEQINHLDLGFHEVELVCSPLLTSDDQDTVEYSFKTTNPVVLFKVTISGENEEEYAFKWAFSEYQVERIHVSLANILHRHLQSNTPYTLPIFSLPEQVFKAIYYATDEQEACRLLSLGLNEMKMHDVFHDFSLENYPDIHELCLLLKTNYIQFIQNYLDHGRYFAQTQSHLLITAYTQLCEKLKTIATFEAKEIIERVYYAFCFIEKSERLDLHNINQVLLSAFHPSVFELIQAQTRFINEAIELNHQESENLPTTFTYDRICNLAEIQSPLLALKQKQGISTQVKSFSWLHFIGSEPSGELDLSIQALLQDNDIDEDDDVKEIIKKVPEQDIIYNVLTDYALANHHVSNGLRILAINVSKLSALLSGLQQYLKQEILKDKNSTPYYTVHLTIYTVGLSQLNAVNSLQIWHRHLLDLFSKLDKKLNLRIHHFVSQRSTIQQRLLIDADKQLYPWTSYDLAFNFDFLQSQAIGKTEAAPIYEFDASANRLNVYPIIYYPKPTYIQTADRRQLLLSNRRIQVQSKHSDLTARLEVTDRKDSEQFFVISETQYDENSKQLIEQLHQMAQWVVNIDQYFDHHLLKLHQTEHTHKVISFSSGYGAYGELNVTVSADKKAHGLLTSQIRRHLSANMPFLRESNLKPLVEKITTLNEGLSGVASIKAILGESEIIRNLYGYALCMQTTPCTDAAILEQWIPLDAFPHWFIDQEYRPDLLKIALQIGENNQPIIHAKIIEAKVGAEVEALLTKAEAQIEAGLLHLKQLFTPINETQSNSYDCRYWWGQLYRALVLRAQLDRAQVRLDDLNIALEKLSEGNYQIHWSSEIVICNTETKQNLSDIKEFFFTHDSLHGNEKKYLVHQYSALSFEQALLKGMDLELTNIKDIHTIVYTQQPTTTEKIDVVKHEDISTFNQEQSQEQTSGSDLDLTDFQTIEDSTSSTELSSTSPSTVVEDIDQPVPAQSIKQNICFGTTGKMLTPVNWPFHHKQLNNRHMMIFGSSGSGKTYAIQCILSELAQTGLSSFIVDYTDGFLTHHTENIYQKVCKPKDYYVIVNPLPINPFKTYSNEIAPGVEVQEKAFNVATRVKNILCSVYKDFGSQQQAIIDKVLEQGLEKNPQYHLTDFLKDLETDSARGESVANKIRTLVKVNCFDTEASENLYEDKLRNEFPVQVIQLTNIPRDLQRIITEFILWDIWAYVQKHGSKDKPITIVLDEMQNLDHAPDSPVDKMLREGRKFGISLVLATQTISNFDKEQKDRLFQASTKLFFKPATTEVDSFAKLLSQVNSDYSVHDWRDRLNQLKKGQCYYLGYVEDQHHQLTEKIILTNITALEQRGFNL
ncbi:ATP-binding protein [Acinetobacter sp. YH12039]|uniref:ATP-binding protein n=1 Tax=Acinetobacter sp. YH12039 TaxID=2601047 RepID=UPI0015D460B4|nr:ATP-binding protein [Acinetobacter sp. YH12039]